MTAKKKTQGKSIDVEVEVQLRSSFERGDCAMTYGKKRARPERRRAFCLCSSPCLAAKRFRGGFCQPVQ